ncbi:hypothetical protein FIU94_09300 [Sulfitobacter sp. THAF37]|uniref:hypothetical protein n=1 Tax=Sulfitobacter sp. THAF37 TaxID=2587855 RepID=UPI0012AA3636|nr:hypothetical protein [Sulfitobacter sp. THAF37]QFT59022.1 hypothetical protein FIU94_09300 [Sulfitobacter sp. THAF37]
MSLDHATPDLFDYRDAQPDLPLGQPLAATEKQMSYARILAAKTGDALPRGIERDRAALSAWIEAHKAAPPAGKFANYPSSKQVAFAERIARLKRGTVPPECFQDKTLMSRWIDSNKPR